MSVWLKRLAIRLLAWLIGDDVAKRGEARTLASERDAAIEAASSMRETADRLEEGRF
jgi:hypothetical protein